MITLFINKIIKKLEAFPPYRQILGKIEANAFPLEIEGVKDGFISIILYKLFHDTGKPSLIVTATEEEAENLYQDLSQFMPEKISIFKWFNILPYENLPPLPELMRQRSSVLTRLLSGERLAVIAPLRALLYYLPPPEVFKKWIARFSRGDTINTTKVESLLETTGYIRVPRVSMKGEFSVRGEVIDIYPASEENAIRIILDFDRVEEIRRFDPITQQSTERLESINIPPMRELILDAGSLDSFTGRLIDAGLEPQSAERLKEEALVQTYARSIHDYSGFLYENPVTLPDYFPESSLLFIRDKTLISSTYKSIAEENVKLYRKRVRNGEDVLPPERLFADIERVTGAMERRIIFSRITDSASQEQAAFRVRIPSDPSRSFFGNISFFKDELKNYLDSGYEVFIFAVYEQQAKRIEFLVRDLDADGRLFVIPSGISSGFAVPQLKILVIQENEIFGRKRRIPRSVARAKTKAIDTFVDLSPGDYVVHLNYGIGLFKGIERIRVLGSERDYIKLEFDGEESIFIPIEQVNLIQKYITQDGRKPKLDRIGGRSWQRRKDRVRKSVEELAERLIRLYSERKSIQGFSYPLDTDWQNEFEAGFPYQETEDQLRCIEEVKRDMESDTPMDRLVCGDVGYGKTEVALRAAFKAVMAGKQVALLAPTTILVEQHYETFSERFRRFPVRIEMLSRFRSRKEQVAVIKGLAEGSVDIVIGTHRLVQRDVHFKNLGLLIVDEEQRFGVKHKEVIKELKTNIDCLTLTATPIPRTLHMSLMKVRDMSLITTPPQNRLPIETIVTEFNTDILRDAIIKEVERGGQVFYLHNRISTIPQVLVMLRQIVPEILVEVAHGQMDEHELEDVMHRFTHGDFHLLLATTIIENGLDIPNVNTIIIDRADMFGISQLYQLRGRVGRSDVPAYAYLLYPRERALSELAMKRLSIISDYTDLGSGFKIALKDLEIRGAGNLLGREQHGDIMAVGFDLYVQLLEESIRKLKKEKRDEPPEPYLELEYSGYIPDSYINEPMEKMEIYKKIASISTEEEMEAVYREIEDRFGPMPEEVLNLLSISETRIICRKLYVSKLVEKNGIARVEFARISKVSADKVIRLISESGGSVFLNPAHPESLFIKTGKIELKDKADFIKERLSLLIDE